jgi:hypothetical protein
MDLLDSEPCLVDSSKIDPSPLPPTRPVAELYMTPGDAGERSDGELKCSGPSCLDDCEPGEL